MTSAGSGFRGSSAAARFRAVAGLFASGPRRDLRDAARRTSGKDGGTAVRAAGQCPGPACRPALRVMTSARPTPVSRDSIQAAKSKYLSSGRSYSARTIVSTRGRNRLHNRLRSCRLRRYGQLGAALGAHEGPALYVQRSRAAQSLLLDLRQRGNHRQLGYRTDDRFDAGHDPELPMGPGSYGQS